MNIKILIITILSFIGCFAFGQGYKIKVKINGYQNDTILLGYHYGEKQYIRDTAIIKKGEFLFKGDTALEQGMYLIVLKPNNEYFQILVDEKQEFSIETDFSALNEKLKIKGSKVNEDLKAYIDYISNRRILADSLNHLLKNSSDAVIIEKLSKQVNTIDEDVKNYQNNIQKTQPKSLLSLVIAWSKDIDIPEFSGTKDEKDEQAFRYYKKHYFDLVDFKDNRAVRLPLFYQKVDRYINKLTVQIPDSISEAIGYILNLTDLKGDNFKYILSNSLNVYANSKYIGMDGVYVYLVENFYAKGKATWIDKESLAKMTQDARALKPLLIDKIAPDITVYKKDSTPVSIHSLKSKYTVLVFWAPDCGHCKQSMPDVIKFQEAFRSKGVEVMAICSKTGTEEKTCWEGVESLKMGSLLNLSDPNPYARFKVIYDLKTTPQIYILDSEKRILSKKIAAEQLGEVMDKLIKYKENETKQ
ncbi:MAG: DUF5106 domain-containing protein [Saprospiraceae bacterium]|nr:DUF5106 domain-containing protein [Saprospiraceae bacterium]